jgi:hypothetical protein
MYEEDPRWELECKSKQCELHKGKIFVRHWSHPWQKKKKKQEKSKL